MTRNPVGTARRGLAANVRSLEVGLHLPRYLDGSEGRNRSPGPSQLDATNDLEAIAAWLMQYTATPTTLNAYRKEAKRLVMWSTVELDKPLSSLTHEDLTSYRAFLANPQPAERWVGTGQKVSHSAEGWKPFAGPLSPSSIQYAFIVLNGLFSWLVQAGYLAGNPVALSRQRKKSAHLPKTNRYLDSDLWPKVIEAIRSMPIGTSREKEAAIRTKWLFSLLYFGGLRISEVCENTMGSFFLKGSKEGSRCWMEIIGKGRKVRLIPVGSELLNELSIYRKAYFYSAFPAQGEQTPLLLPIGGKAVPLKRAMVHNIIKAAFERAAMLAESEFQAERLRSASAHWLRHTSGSHMADAGIDLRFVRDNLGHSNLTTTSIYLHGEDDPRHDATTKALHINWN